jgi:hypothetical protein
MEYMARCPVYNPAGGVYSAYSFVCFLVVLPTFVKEILVRRFAVSMASASFALSRSSRLRSREKRDGK